MNKILLVFDGSHFSEGAFKWASYFNEINPCRLTGIFLQPIDYRDIVGYTGAGNAVPITLTPFQSDTSVIKKNVAQFENRCQREGIEYRTHMDTDMFALEELQTETRFADFMIISAELFYENIGKDQPNDYMKKILRQTECPVFIVPEEFKPVHTVLLAYDGKADSVFAIKQFSYLFPELCRKESKLITIEDEDEPFPHQDLIEELASKHFPNLTFELVDKEKIETFSDWVSTEPGSMLVAGSYGRSELSNLFKKSFLSGVIEEHSMPVFIAHR
jgi:hypothetical protein